MNMKTPLALAAACTLTTLCACSSSGESEDGIEITIKASPVATTHHAHEEDAAAVKRSSEAYARFRRSDGTQIDLEQGLLNLVPVELLPCADASASAATAYGLLRLLGTASLPIASAYAHSDGGGATPEGTVSVVEGEDTDLGTLTAEPGNYCGIALELVPGTEAGLGGAAVAAMACYYATTVGLSDADAAAVSDHSCIETAYSGSARRVELAFGAPVPVNADHRSLAVQVAVRYEEWFDGLDLTQLATDAAEQSRLVDNIAASMQALTGDEQLVTLAFEVHVNGEEAVCGQSYAGLGNTVQPLRMEGFRFYASDFALENDAGGQRLRLGTKPNATVYEDGRHSVALMGHTQGCDSSVPLRNLTLSGAVPSGAYARMCFTLGVPFELNHSDVSTAPSPLDVTAMTWNWLSGRIFLRFDALVPALDAEAGNPELNQNFFVHLGSTGCSNGSSDFGAPPDAECAYPNRPRICLAYDEIAAGHAIVADLAPVIAEQDLRYNTADTAPGCMSFPGDPECSTVMPRLGLDYALDANTVLPAQDQQLFEVEAP